MSALIKYIIDRLKERRVGQLPIEAFEGTYYSTLTGSDPPYIEVDWPKLQADMEALEEEFQAQKEC